MKKFKVGDKIKYSKLGFDPSKYGMEGIITNFSDDTHCIVVITKNISMYKDKLCGDNIQFCTSNIDYIEEDFELTNYEEWAEE